MKHYLDQRPKNEYFNQLSPNYTSWYQLYLDVKIKGRLDDWNNGKYLKYHYSLPLKDETDQSYDQYTFDPSFANSMIVKEIDGILSGLNEDSFLKLKYLANGGTFFPSDERFKEISSLFLNLELFVIKK
jgi:hypothetical protein